MVTILEPQSASITTTYFKPEASVPSQSGTPPVPGSGIIFGVRIPVSSPTSATKPAEPLKEKKKPVIKEIAKPIISIDKV
jgi:hypothetical protein